MGYMNNQDLAHLVRKYYGYVADMEGSGVEAFDLLFVRDKIQAVLDESTPEKEISTTLYEQVHELDRLLWAERETFLAVVGTQELHHARQQQQSPRSHWWWYLDNLVTVPSPLQAQHQHVSQTLVPV
jgi:hypothetical protein